MYVLIIWSAVAYANIRLPPLMNNHMVPRTMSTPPRTTLKGSWADMTYLTGQKVGCNHNEHIFAIRCISMSVCRCLT